MENDFFKENKALGTTIVVFISLMAIIFSLYCGAKVGPPIGEFIYNITHSQ